MPHKRDRQGRGPRGHHKDGRGGSFGKGGKGGKHTAVEAKSGPDYPSYGSILVVGDGDFSFSSSLLQQGVRGETLVATSYDTGPIVREKYPDTAKRCLSQLRKASATTMHGVNACDVHNRRFLQHLVRADTCPNPPFDVIVFNFPHSGNQRVHENRALLRDFFLSAREIVSSTGEIHVALKRRPPYSEWNVEEQAARGGCMLRRILPFERKMYPGYAHRTTDPDAKKFEQEKSSTFVFAPMKVPGEVRVVETMGIRPTPSPEASEARKSKPSRRSKATSISQSDSLGSGGPLTVVTAGQKRPRSVAVAVSGRGCDSSSSEVVGGGGGGGGGGPGSCDGSIAGGKQDARTDGTTDHGSDSKAKRRKARDVHNPDAETCKCSECRRRRWEESNSNKSKK